MSVNFASVIKRCESAGGAGSKKVIKEALAELDPTSRRLMYYLYNPFYTFGVKKFDDPICHAKNDSKIDAAVANLFDVLDKLRTRELTGNRARQAVTDAMELFTEEDAGYFIRVLLKDPKAGFSADTYNKVWENEPVPVFKLMLADKCEDFEELESVITYPCQADIKYDGERNLCIVLENEVTYLSRSGLEAEHMIGLFDEELLKIRAELGYDYVLDGERMAATYIETVNAKKSGVEGELGKKNMKFRGFFLMPLTEWTAEVSTITMRQSRDHITQLCDKLGLTKITVSKGKEVHSHEEMMAYLEEVTQPGYDGLPKGQEGLILKNWNGLYQWDRVMDWCKVKKFFDVDVRIVGFVEGRAGTKLEGTLGRINYVGFLEDGTRVEGGVGSGLKEKKPKDDPDCPTRDEIWNNQEKFLGTTIVVKYQEVSKGKAKQHASLRFPTVFRFRDDKVVEID